MDDKEHSWHDLTSEQARAMRAAIMFAMWRAVTFAACIAVFVGIVALYSRGVKAEEIPVHVYEQGGTTIRLMPGPCVEEMSKAFISQAGPEALSRFRAIESTWRYQDGSYKKHQGCWGEFSAVETGRGVDVFFLIFDDGQRNTVDKAEFLRGKGSGT